MELILMLRVLARRWWLVLLPPVVAGALTLPSLLSGGAAVSGGFTTAIRYSAAQELGALPVERDGDYQDVWLASELTVNALTGWVTTSSFRDEVALRLTDAGLTIDPDTLNIVADNERSIGVIYLSWADAAELEQIAGAAIEVLQTRNQVYFRQLGDVPADVTILDAPQIAAAPPPIVDRLGPVIRVGLGVLVGLGLALLAEYFDTTLRRRDEIEALGYTLIASIPRE